MPHVVRVAAVVMLSFACSEKKPESAPAPTAAPTLAPDPPPQPEWFERWRVVAQADIGRFSKVTYEGGFLLQGMRSRQRSWSTDGATLLQLEVPEEEDLTYAHAYRAPTHLFVGKRSLHLTDDWETWKTVPVPAESIDAI